MVAKLDGVWCLAQNGGTGDLTLGAAIGSTFLTVPDLVAISGYSYGGSEYYVVTDGVNREVGKAPVILSGSDAVLQRSAGTRLWSTQNASGPTWNACDFASGGITQVYLVAPDAVKLLTDDLQANGGLIPTIDRTNAFAADQRLDSTAKTAAATLRALQFQGLSDDDVARIYATIAGKVVDPADGAEDGALLFRGMVAGVLADLLHVGADGIAAGALSKKGKDTAHYQEVWANDTLLGAARGQKIGSTQTVAAVSAVDFTGINSSFNTYELHYSNVTCSGTGGSPAIRTSTDGGSSFDSGASDYQRRFVGAADAAQSSIAVNNMATGETGAGVVRFFQPSAASPLLFQFQSIRYHPGTPALDTSQGSGARNAAADVDAIRVINNNGGTISGTFILYGWNA